MAPNRGIAAHFAASKASISRSNPSSRSAKAKLLTDVTTSTIKSSAVSKPASDDNVSTTLPSKPTTPKKRQTRTRLRTPEEGEVDRIIAENQQGLLSSPSRLSSSTGPFTSESDVASTSLLGTPPTTPHAGRSSPLLEPTHMSPISVRTEPDTKKMFLMLPRSPAKTITAPVAFSSTSPNKRKVTTPPKNTSPTKTPRTLDGTPRRLITGETEMFGTEEEDGLVLTPGRSKGTRIALGSPSKSPLLARLGNTPKDKALRGIVDQDAEDDRNYITPRTVRERAKGLPLPPMATEKAAAVFRGASLPSSSSAPSLIQIPKHRLEEPIGLSHSEIEKPTTTDELILPKLKHTLSSDLPLPSFYSSLMSLHVALEHALVVHLATAGCSSATLQSSADASDSDSDQQSSSTSEKKKTKTVRLPNLISYSALRPLVERSGGRRLGPTELRRLASVWTDFHQKSAAIDSAEEQEEVKGLGFIITKTRSMDPRTGRRALDWGIGIELEIKRTVRESTPPPSVGFGGVQLQSSPILPSSASAIGSFDESVRGTPKMPTRFTTPSPSSPRMNLKSPMHASPKKRVPRAISPTPSSPKARSSIGAVKAREGMSVVAMWNNGLEVRKAEVGRRLRERCGRFHQLWLDDKGISVPPSPTKVKQEAEPATPSKQLHQVGLGISEDSDAEDESKPPPPREVIVGAGGLLTPSATRSGGRRIGKRIFHVDPTELDARTLSEEDEEEQELTPGKTAREQGKKSLMDEVLRTELRSSKSLPSLRSSSSAGTGEVPPEGQELKAWHVDFPVDDPKVVRPVPLATLPLLTAPLATPHRNKEKSMVGLGINDTPKKPVKYTTSTALTDLAPSTPASVSTAGMTLRERIAAKEQLRRTASLPSLANTSLSSSSQTDLTPMQALSQRALVSRLPELSNILFMLFSNGTTLSSTGITRSPTIPMQDLLNKLSKSVKIQLSPRECRSAIDMLGKIAPGFLIVLDPSDGGMGGGKEYVRLGSNGETGNLWRLNEVRTKIASQLNGK